MPCSICRETGHNARTCCFNECELDCEELDFIEVPDYAEDEDAEFDAYLEKLNVEVAADRLAFIKSLEDEVEQEKSECIICYECVDDGKVSLKCGHVYCVGCFVKHMRMNNTCAYCRTELCEAPQSKKHMPPDTRTALIEQAFDNRADALYETLRGDFMRQMELSVREQLLSKHGLNLRSVAAANEMCARAVMSVDVTFAAWIIGLQTSNYISDWYER